MEKTMGKPTKRPSKNRTLILTTTGMLIAIGILMPQVFHSVPNAGSIFLPMHIPVLLCGLICGAVAGGLSGAVTPIISWLIFGMPPAPNALVPMVFELFVYGLVSGAVNGLLLKNDKTKKFSFVIALLVAMLAGRIVSIAVKLVLLSAIFGGSLNEVFTAALMGGFVICWPGIIIQLGFIPALMATLEKANILVKYRLSETPKGQDSVLQTSEKIS
jgi:niacin transporter